MSNPFAFFEQWFVAAEEAKVIEPNAMVLSTINEKNAPTSRVVLFKRFENDILYFFTNYNSDKSKHLSKNPLACVNFHWRAPLHRQVRIEGSVTKADAKISDEYFKSRPRGSQIGAWASAQSQTISGRSELEKKVKDFEDQFGDKPVPRPEFWGGWGMVPSKFEFWEEGDFRLHTRTVFEKQGDVWTQKLVSP